MIRGACILQRLGGAVAGCEPLRPDAPATDLADALVVQAYPDDRRQGNHAPAGRTMAVGVKVRSESGPMAR